MPAEDGIDIQLHWDIGTQSIAHTEVSMLGSGLVMESFTLHAVADITALKMAERFFPDGEQHMRHDDWPRFLEEEVMRWRNTLPVQFDDRLIEQSSTVKPTFRMHLSERDRVLVLQPAFVYGNTEIRWGYEGDITVPHEGRVRIMRRQPEAEEAFLQSIRNLHSDMQRSAAEHFFYLSSDAVLAGSWFFRFMDAMRELNVPVTGFEGLKRLRISTFKPTDGSPRIVRH